MTSSNNYRRQFFANKLHRDLFFLFFLAAVIPSIIVEIAVFYLILNLAAEQLAIPESIVYNLIPVAKKTIATLCIITPFAILVIMIFAHKITHRIVGPFDRIIRELDECISGTKTTPIVLRKDDKFLPLVDKINLLIEKLKR